MNDHRAAEAELPEHITTDIDPHELPCEECGAQPHEACGPECTGAAQFYERDEPELDGMPCGECGAEAEKPCHPSCVAVWKS